MASFRVLLVFVELFEVGKCLTVVVVRGIMVLGKARVLWRQATSCVILEIPFFFPFEFLFPHL